MTITPGTTEDHVGSQHDSWHPDYSSSAPLLEVDDLHVEFPLRGRTVNAVRGVSYHVDAGETLGVIGESGSGKSVTAQAIMGIIDAPGRVTRGEIRYRGVNLLELDDRRRREARGETVAMIFQDALSALNPVFSVGFQVAEMFRKRRGMSRRDAKRAAVEVMDRARIPSAADRFHDYPHEFSGGMRQRVMLAIALALDPDVLIADEPTTALDVTIQAQVMELLKEIQVERQMGLILITHDMGVVADVCDRIAVMYAGSIVEQAPVHDIYAAPAHPYTKALLRSIPRLDRKGEDLETIEGRPPALDALVPGCSFHPRCPYARERCESDPPPLYEVTGARGSACHYWQEVIES